MNGERRVVLVCGPPGAGKTTYARSLGLDVYDLDDDQWGNSEAAFSAALRRLGAQPGAQAVVIRAGATRTARARTQRIAGVTETRIITTPQHECIERVVKRNRPRPSIKVQIAAVGKWWANYEPEPVTAETIREW